MDASEQLQHEPVTRGRLGTVAWIACSLVLVAVVVGVWLRVNGTEAGANLAASIIAGKRPIAPALPTAQIDDDGAPGRPAWYRASGSHQAPSADAQVLVVNWWASWCGPCEDEAPILQQVAEDYAGRVTVVGLNPMHQDLESDARSFVRDHHFTFPILRAPRSEEDAWGVRTFPKTFIVGTDGRLSAYVDGPIDEETITGLLDAELRKRRS